MQLRMIRLPNWMTKLIKLAQSYVKNGVNTGWMAMPQLVNLATPQKQQLAKLDKADN